MFFSLCRSDLAANIYEAPHRGGSGRKHERGITRPSSGSVPSIASLVSLIDGQSGGRPGGRQWMNASSKVTSSRVRVYKPKVSHLFAFFAFAPNRVRHSGCCMAPLFLPLGRMHGDAPSLCVPPPRMLLRRPATPRHFVPVRRCVHRSVTRRIVEPGQTRNSGASFVTPDCWRLPSWGC